MIPRKFAGVWGIVSSVVMAVVIMAVLLAVGAPAAVLWGGGTFAALLLGLQAVSAVRGWGRAPRGEDAFASNALGVQE